jgi:two-component system, NtrC family, sensor histidine kinase HydH
MSGSPPRPEGEGGDALRRQVATVHGIQFLITAHRDLQEVLDTIVRSARDALGALECTIRLTERDEEGDICLRVAAWAGRPVYTRHFWPLRRGSLDDIVISGQLVEITDMRTDPRVKNPQALIDRGIVSMLAAPLRIGDQIIGGLRIYTGERKLFSATEKDLLESLAGQAAIAIENARLYHELAEAHRTTQRSYEELRAAPTELVKREKLAALGEMAALVAHEIRNPLTAVRGFAQRIQRRVVEDTGLVQACQIIMDEVDRLNKVIVDVLDFARNLEPRFAGHSLNQLVQDVLRLETPTLTERGIAIHCDCNPHLGPVRLDAGQIRQVLLNLIANARQLLTGEGGQITLCTRRPEPGWQALDVTDNGPGIPPEVQGKIFTPFFTTKLRGTGLGLTAAQRILDDHGGRLSFETEVGKGTTFTLWLPEGESG